MAKLVKCHICEKNVQLAKAIKYKGRYAHCKCMEKVYKQFRPIDEFL